MARAKQQAEERTREAEAARASKEEARLAREELCGEMREAEEIAKRNAIAGVLSPAAKAHVHAKSAAHVGVDLSAARGAAEDAAARAAKARAASLAANEMTRQQSHKFLRAQPKKKG